MATPVVRGSSIAFVNSNNGAIAVPAGSQPGDTMIVFGGHGFQVNPPAGWTAINTGSGSNYNGGVFYKTLLGTDVAAGSVTVNFSGNFQGTLAAVSFVGPQVIRDSGTVRNSTGATSRSISSGAAPEVGDYALFFGSGRLNALPTSTSLTTTLESSANNNTSAILRGGDVTGAGVQTGTVNYSSTPNGDYAAIIIVAVSTLWEPWHLPAGTLVRWWDARDAQTMTLASGAVANWRDKFSALAANQVQNATVAARPLFNADGLSTGHPGVVFDGVNDILANDKQPELYNNATGATVFAVMKGLHGANKAWWGEGNSGNSATEYSLGRCSSVTNEVGLGRIIDSAAVTAVGPTNPRFTGNPYDGNPVIVGVTDTKTDIVGHLNGETGATVSGVPQGTSVAYTRSGTATAFNRFSLGAITKNSAGGYMECTLSEIILTSRPLTQEERENLEGYFAWRWGLQDLLPVGHPRKSAPPTIDSSGISATASITFGALTSSATGALAITAASITSLGPLTTVSSGALTIRASASGQLGALTSTATGKLKIVGAGDVVLGQMLGSSAGTLPIDGDAGVTLSALTVNATGKLDIAASASIVLGALTAVSSGEIVAPGSGSVDTTLGALTVAATGVLPIAAASAIELGSLTMLSSGGRVTSAALRFRVAVRGLRSFSVPAPLRAFRIKERIVVQ